MALNMKSNADETANDGGNSSNPVSPRSLLSLEYQRFQHSNQSSTSFSVLSAAATDRANQQRVMRLLISTAIFFVSYCIMGVFGGSVAYMRFPRYPYQNVPNQLDDIGYDIFDYFCPLWTPPRTRLFHLKTQNIQSVVLIIFYIRLFYGIYRRRRTDGALIFQRLLHITSLVFLTRTTTVGFTNLPQPNPRCVRAQQQLFNKSFFQAIKFVMGRGFPPHACGDLIYSGHVACTLVCFAVMHRHQYFQGRYMLLDIMVIWSLMCLGIYAVVACRSHYTIDVVLAFYFTFFLTGWYFLRVDGVVHGKFSRAISWIECRDKNFLETEKKSFMATIQNSTTNLSESYGQNEAFMCYYGGDDQPDDGQRRVKK